MAGDKVEPTPGQESRHFGVGRADGVGGRDGAGGRTVGEQEPHGLKVAAPGGGAEGGVENARLPGERQEDEHEAVEAPPGGDGQRVAIPCEPAKVEPPGLDQRLDLEEHALGAEAPDVRLGLGLIWHDACSPEGLL